MIKRVFCVTAGLDDIDGEDAIQTNEAFRKYLGAEGCRGWGDYDLSSDTDADDETSDESDGNEDASDNSENDANLGEADADEDGGGEADADEDGGAVSDEDSKLSEKERSCPPSETLNESKRARSASVLSSIECSVEKTKRRGKFHCDICADKVFLQEEDFQKHMLSKLHKKRAKKAKKAQKEFDKGTLGLHTPKEKTSKTRKRGKRDHSKLTEDQILKRKEKFKLKKQRRAERNET